jgi:hypothetical protein
MAFDRDGDWSERVRGLSQRPVVAREAELQATRRAAIAAGNVTGDEHWDHFLSVIQTRLNSVRERRDGALKRLSESDNFTTADIINEKLAVRLLGCEIETLEWAVALPRALMEQGDKASELLESASDSTH